ncbi:MAG TPA: hypothetical protein VJA21_05465 [Verrucomicrobiae bacterium]
MRDFAIELLNSSARSEAADPGFRTRNRRPQPWAALLELCYARVGLPLPCLEKVGEEQIPQPYRKLLVHSMDLTPTLESFYHRTLGIFVLHRWRDGDTYRREVILRLAGDWQRVGYGAIRIELRHLPPASAARVLAEQVPFGSILQADGIPHLSWPQDFFRAEPDPHLRSMLGLRRNAGVYGRRNVLLDGSRRLLAEVVELLAPVAGHVTKRSRGRALSPVRNTADRHPEE